jgi:hypothetical protein
MITVQADAASSEKGQGSSASAAAQAAAQEAMLPHMMEALWQMNVLDIEMTLEKVVDKVLHDRAISKKVCDANRIGAKPKIHEEVLFLHCCCPACTALRRVSREAPSLCCRANRGGVLSIAHRARGPRFASNVTAV